MNNDFNKITNYWKTQYSNQITKYTSYKNSDRFNQIASLFAPGKSYYYILNMHNLELDYVSDSVKNFTGIAPNRVTMKDLLQLALSEEIKNIEQKEAVIKDFSTQFLQPEEIMDYKLLYTYRMKDHMGKIRTILLQITVLSVNENGTIEHVLGLHSDISHLRVTSSNDISFIHNGEGKSYYNINPSQRLFKPEFSEYKEIDLSELLSDREKEIINKLAQGLSAQNIADDLYLSPHTVKTHRKNILQKTSCANTVELVAKCLTGGVISIGLN